MGQDHRGQGLNRSDIPDNTWVVLDEPFAPTCLDSSHRTVEGKPVAGPGGKSGPVPGALGFAAASSPDIDVDTHYVSVWWIGWTNGHDGLGATYMPKWSTPRSCYWVCAHQLRLPTPDEEGEIVRFLLGAGP